MAADLLPSLLCLFLLASSAGGRSPTDIRNNEVQPEIFALLLLDQRNFEFSVWGKEKKHVTCGKV